MLVFLMGRSRLLSERHPLSAVGVPRPRCFEHLLFLSGWLRQLACGPIPLSPHVNPRPRCEPPSPCSFDSLKLVTDPPLKHYPPVVEATEVCA